jgi:hypothetical protein
MPLPTYRLVIRQQPRRARITGLGGEIRQAEFEPGPPRVNTTFRPTVYADRRPVDPPVIAQVVPGTALPDAPPLPDVLLSPFRFFVVADLVRADVDVDMPHLEVGRARSLLDES